MKTSSAALESGGVKTTARDYVDEAGKKQHLVFRDIDHGQGPHCYDIERDGVLHPRLDKSLYEKLFAMSDAQLSYYFSDQ